MRCNLLNYHSGFAPIWIILLIFLFGGLFILAKNYSNPFNKSSQNQTANTSKESPTAKPSVKKLSLREICLEKIKDLPPPPHSYGTKSTGDTLLPLYKRKERFPNEEKASACETRFGIFKVREQAFADMGLTYYKFDKSINKNLPNYPDLLKNFPKKVDTAYTEAMKAKGWNRTTLVGEQEGGLPYIVYYKEDGVYKMYADVTLAGDSHMTMRVSIIEN